MKINFKSITALIICFVMVTALFTACGKKSSSEETTTTQVTWAQDGAYQPVQVGASEMEAIVDEALGDDNDFDGDLGSLSDDDYSKVVEYAEDVKGYTVQKGDSKSDTVIIKNQNNYTTAAATVIETVTVTDKSGEAVTDKNGDAVTATVKSTVSETQTDKNGNVVTSDGTTSPVINGTTKNASAATTGGNKDNNGGSAGSANTSYVAQTTTETTKAVSYSGITQAAASGFFNDSDCNFVAAKTSSDGGAIAVGTTTSNASGKSLSYSAAAIAKFNTDGTKAWGHIISGDNSTALEDVAVLSDGTIIAVGYTLASNITSASAYKCQDTVEGVILKYDSTGKLLWTKIFGGSGGDIIYSVAATPDGGFYIGGKSTSTDGDLKDSGAGKISAYYAKYASNGQLLWTKAFTGSKHCAVFDIAVTSDGSAYLAIESICKDGSFVSVDGASTGRKYTVAVKINSDGSVKWAKGLWESGTVSLKKVVVANDGGCVLAGTYTSVATGNTGSFGELYNGGPAGTTDGIIYKLNGNGERVWATPLVGYESDYITDIVAVKSGYAVTGYTTSTNRDFAFTNKGDYDSFVYIYSNAGVREAAKGFGGTGSDRAMCVCATGTTVYVLGSSSSSDGDFAKATVKSDGSKSAAFIVKFTLAVQS